MFGQPSAAPVTQGLLFGAPKPGGAAAPSFGAFGAASTPAASGAPGTSFGAFGAAAPAAPGAPASTGFGAFGAAASQPGANPAAPALSFGSFGATSQPGAPATSTAAPGGFGSFGAAPTSAPATGGFGGFGAATSTAAAPAAGGFGGFGSSLAAPATSTAPIGFGSFGASTAPAPGQSTFGSFGGLGAAPKPANSFLSVSALGSSTAQPQTGSLGASMSSASRQQYLQGTGQPNIPVWQQLMHVKNSFDRNHPNCVFRHYFYNLVHPDDMPKYGPPQGVDPQEWYQAKEASPDPTCLVPALAIGFDDIKARMESQNEMQEMQRKKLQEIEVKLKEMNQFHVLQTANRVKEFKRRHIQLSQRVLTLVKRVQISKAKGTPITAEEEALRVRLENMLEQLKNPAHFRGKITELWAQIQVLKDSKRLNGGVSSGLYEVADEAQLEPIAKVLQEHTQALEHMMGVIQQDMGEIEILQRKLEEK